MPDVQEEIFFQRVPVGGKLRIFGSAQVTEIPSEPKAEHERILATMPPAELLAGSADQLPAVGQFLLARHRGGRPDERPEHGPRPMRND